MNPSHHRPLFAMLIALPLIAACTKEPALPPVPKTATAIAEAAPSAGPAAAPAPAATEPHEDAIAWRRGNVDAAFAEAKAAGKPVFLYWGAAWCPPCNQMKATLFKQREFIERTQAFVPVYIDGDTPAAQQLGTRFAVSGYPTMVLFRPDGTEITRLPGEADPERYLQVLAIGMNGARPVSDTLKTALADGHGLTSDDWRMLAWYSWDTDDQQLVPTARVPATLQSLAAHCPTTDAGPRARLMLKTAAAAGEDGKSAPAIRIERRAALINLQAVLASPTASRENFDLLTDAMPEIVRATTAPGSAERRAVTADADGVLARLAADTTLSNTDRLGATIARVQLAAIDAKPVTGHGSVVPAALSPELRATIDSEVARADRESTNPYERQTVINAAAYLLTAAGLLDRSDALLRAELTRSHSPYYFMLDLASNAKKRGDDAAAIDWYAKAYDAAKGPATRLQWGATYVNALIDLAPDDASRIEQAARQVIGEVEPEAASFDGRNRKSLSRMATKIATWSAKGQHADAATHIAAASRALCDRVPAEAPEHARCGELLKVGSSMEKPRA
jgi:thiol-disulfide isomerase/thioredoxin